jgi:hypothetical protein
MQVGIHANSVDGDTERLGWALRPVFAILSRQLEGDYGGLMEHLWIDMELIEHHLKADGSHRHPFRFRKRVSGRGQFGLPLIPDSFNVGHFSVRPDVDFLITLPLEDAIAYVLQLIYHASAVLLEKQERHGGFNADLFRERFLIECQRLGHLQMPATRPSSLDTVAVSK